MNICGARDSVYHSPPSGPQRFASSPNADYAQCLQGLLSSKPQISSKPHLFKSLSSYCLNHLTHILMIRACAYLGGAFSPPTKNTYHHVKSIFCGLCHVVYSLCQACILRVVSFCSECIQTRGFSTGPKCRD